MKKQILINVLAFACVSVSYSGERLASLSAADGRVLFRQIYKDSSFAKGAGGNDVSRLLPFRFGMGANACFAVFSTAENEYNDGISWETAAILDGCLDPKAKNGSSFWFKPSQIFCVDYECGDRRLVYHSESWRRVPTAENPEMALLTLHWFAIDLDTNGVPCTAVLRNGAGDLFGDPNVQSIRNVVPWRYRGASAEIVTPPTRESARLEEFAEAGDQWTLSEAQEKQLALRHLQTASADDFTVVVSNVYVIACDANADGIVDAYVSSDAERREDEDYKWTLYLGAKDGFVRRESPLILKPKWYEEIVCECEVVAAQDAFFRFDRIGMPAYVMPVVRREGKTESLSYLDRASVVRATRAKEGLGDAEFFCCVGTKKCGVASLQDLFVLPEMLVSATRLPCRALAVEAERTSPLDALEAAVKDNSIDGVRQL